MSDVYPQFLRGRVVESAANTYTEVEIKTPVVTQISGSGKAQVMEILDFHIQRAPGAGAAADEVKVHVSENSKSAITDIDTAGIWYSDAEVNDAATGGAKIHTHITVPFATSGKGPLYGKPSLYLAVHGSSQSVAMYANIIVTYRLVQVNANELLGLVAS